MQIKVVGQAMMQITVYKTNLLALLCFTYKVMMVYYALKQQHLYLIFPEEH